MLIQSFADLVVLALVVGAIYLAVRGMRRGAVKACDSGCGGACASCGVPCATPHIELTDHQRAQLASLRERFEATS